MGLLAKFWATDPLDNPQFSLNDPAAWDYLGSGGPSASGVRVGRESALTYSPWWRGVTLKARDIAKIPLVIYKKEGKGRVIDRAHPAYRLLRWKPNERQTAFDWKQQMMGHRFSTGNGYSYIMRRGDGMPMEILPLNPDTTWPVLENGRLWYVTTYWTGEIEETRKLDSTNVIHFKGFGFDGLIGYSVVEKAKEAIGLGIALRKSEAAFFKNSGRPSVVLVYPAKMVDTAKQKLREDWERMHSGIDNAHRTAILDGGMDIKTLSFSPEDQRIFELSQFSLIDIANFLDLPPHKLGHPSRTSFASIEQENLSYLSESLDPDLIAIEEECRDKLLTENEKDEETHCPEFVRHRLVLQDSRSRAEVNRIALGGRPWKTENEAREEDGLNPDPDPNADMVALPLNMNDPGGRPQPSEDNAAVIKTVPVKAIATETTLTPTSEEPKEIDTSALTVALGDAYRRMARRVAHQARKKAKNTGAYCDWLDAMVEENSRVVVEAIAPPFDALMTATRQTNKDAAWFASGFLMGMRDRYSALADEQTPEALPGAVDALAKDIEDGVGELLKELRGES